MGSACPGRSARMSAPGPPSHGSPGYHHILFPERPPEPAGGAAHPSHQHSSQRPAEQGSKGSSAIPSSVSLCDFPFGQWARDLSKGETSFSQGDSETHALLTGYFPSPLHKVATESSPILEVVKGKQQAASHQIRTSAHLSQHCQVTADSDSPRVPPGYKLSHLRTFN